MIWIIFTTSFPVVMIWWWWSTFIFVFTTIFVMLISATVVFRWATVIWKMFIVNFMDQHRLHLMECWIESLWTKTIVYHDDANIGTVGLKSFEYVLKAVDISEIKHTSQSENHTAHSLWDKARTLETPKRISTNRKVICDYWCISSPPHFGNLNRWRWISYDYLRGKSWKYCSCHHIISRMLDSALYFCEFAQLF